MIAETDVDADEILERENETNQSRKLSPSDQCCSLNCLLIALGILLLVVFNLFLLLILTTTALFLKEESSNTRTCTTATCVEIAGEILQKLDQSADPCDDFFQYSCGRWVKNNYIPFSKADTVGHVQSNILKDLITKIESWNQINVSLAKRKVYDYYVSCINESIAMDRNGKKLLLDFVHDLGNTSFLGAAGANTSDFKKSLKTVLTKYFLMSFMTIDFDRIHQTKVVRVWPFIATLGSSKYFLNITGNINIENRFVHNFYKEFMKKIFRILGSPLSKNAIDIKVNDIIALETKMLKLFLQESGAKTESFNMNSIPNSLDYFNFKDIIISFIESTSVSIDDIKYVNISKLSFFRKLDFLIASENSDTLHNYVLWVGVCQLLEWTSSELRFYRNRFFQLLQGYRIKRYMKEPRSDFCMYTILENKQMESILSLEYLKNNKLDTVLIDNVMERIQSAFKKNVLKTSWLDIESQESVLERFKNITVTWGKPEHLLNESHIEKDMEELDIDARSYFQNNMNLWKMKKVEAYQNPILRKRPIKPYIVNAIFSHESNMAVFHNGIFRKPFYHANWTSSQIFGALRWVIGHQFMHMFENLGKQRDIDSFDILSDDSHDKFKEMSACLIEQYNNYSIHGQSLRGAYNFDENFSDNVGLSIAYRAFLEWVRENGHEKRYPGIQLTEEQLFFVSFAQQFCAKYSKEHAFLDIMLNNHSPFKFRIIGSVSNSEDFSNAYKCKRGSKMNPIKKCVYV